MINKITIGLFIDTFFPMVDGVVMVVDNYAKRLVNYANVIVFAPEYPGVKYDDSKFEYKVVRCKSLKLPKLDYGLPVPKVDKDFMSKLENAKLDIVHIHSPFSMGKVGINYAKRNNIPVIGTMHSQYKQDFLRAVKFKPLATVLTQMIIKQYNNCNECWAVNTGVAKVYYDDYHCRMMPKVMNNATDMKPLNNIAYSLDIINKKHNIKEDEKVFLFVGRINKLKNVFFIANSLKILKEKFNFKFKMIYIGTGQDEENLKKIIIKNNMKNEIIMCGKITDRDALASYYARADLFLFPSLYDASSIVQIEAASQKTPTLFIEGAVTASTIKDNINGFVATNKEEDYATRIKEIMENKSLYQKVCENAYKDIYVDWDSQINKVYHSYLDHINKTKNSGMSG